MKPDYFNNSAIGWASYNGRLEVVRLLLTNKSVDPADEDNFAILYASTNGHHKVVELLLKYPGVNPSAQNNIAVKLASEKGHEKVVELLLKNGVDPSVDDNYAIRRASENNHLEVVKLLLNDPRVDPSKCINICEYLIKIGDKNLVEKILKDERCKKVHSVLLSIKNIM